MKELLIVAGVFALASCRPTTVLEYEGDNHEHKQEGESGNKVEGSYSWTSPEGIEYYVKYVADEDGFRIVDSNAVPVSADGQKADGNQGSFGEDEGEEGGGGEGERKK